ncbi:MAG: MATE family efflux transporter [Spirochaetes bacterium]|nr:MATE family efflux transporter [Spirochaetota bacterium]MBU1079766.1 MATE family efflux transporter [Spirochaetota bacterium]
MRIPPLYRKVLAIAAPSVVELVLTAMTQFVDTVMVGRLGAYAISAVGLTTQPRFIMLAVFIALNVGATALVARFKGQGDRKAAELVSAQSVILAVLASLLLTVPGILFARPMVLFMGAAPDTVDASARYFSILMAGFAPTVLPIAISALLRGVGDAKTSMRYNVTANLVNVAFNYLLIYGKFGFPALGVSGAAIATVIGNSVACAMALFAVAGRRSRKGRISYAVLRFTKDNCVPNPAMLKRIIRIGLPSAAEQFALRVGLLIYTITITALGTRVFAAHQIVLSILNLSFVNGQAFGIAATSLSGQALGRGEPDEAKAASGACQRLGAFISTAMGLGMFAFRRELILLFTSDPEIVALGAGVMLIVALIQPFQSSFQIYAGALRGAGDSLYPAISLAIGILGIRPALSYVFVHVLSLGLFGAWLALIADQFARFVLILARFKSGKWVHIKV